MEREKFIHELEKKGWRRRRSIPGKVLGSRELQEWRRSSSYFWLVIVDDKVVS
jgi:hypothetical protein